MRDKLWSEAAFGELGDTDGDKEQIEWSNSGMLVMHDVSDSFGTIAGCHFPIPTLLEFIDLI